MATAKTKIEASPFLIRRAEILKKLHANKSWLEESFQKLKEYNPEEWDRRKVEEWVLSNWNTILELMASQENVGLNTSWHQNWEQNGRIEIVVDLHAIPSFPPVANKATTTGLQMSALMDAVKPAFISSTDNRGKENPSTYKKICQYISLFEESNDEFLDGKAYPDLSNLISDYEAQFKLVGQIN